MKKIKFIEYLIKDLSAYLISFFIFLFFISLFFPSMRNYFNPVLLFITSLSLFIFSLFLEKRKIKKRELDYFDEDFDYFDIKRIILTREEKLKVLIISIITLAVIITSCLIYKISFSIEIILFFVILFVLILSLFYELEKLDKKRRIYFGEIF